MNTASVPKTCKLFIGGAFPRTESGRTLPAYAADGRTVLARICRASRKDLRDAVVAARKAQPGWAARTGYLRGQILYRIAELLSARADELADTIGRSAGPRLAAHRREVQASVDCLLSFAGWCDKFTQIAGSVNPVSTPHFNFTRPEPTGVVGLVCPDEFPLFSLVALLAPALVPGNTVIALVSERHPLAAIPFAEILAASDVPPGTVNLLTGLRSELVPQFATHLDINAIVDGSGDPALGRILQEGVATNLKRVTLRTLPPPGRTSRPPTANPDWIRDTVELKTTWHPVGL